MRVLARALEFCARHGRWGLVVGLVIGLAFPTLAQAMRPYLPQMVACLLGITAFRIGYRASVGQIAAGPRVLGEVLALQLALPLVGLGAISLLGLQGTLGGLAIVLMLCAPAISGSANFAVLLGHAPAPALQILVLGTALFPATALPVLLLLGPALGEVGTILWTSLRLTAVILGATGLGCAARALFLPNPTPAQVMRLDGLGVVALGVIVVGLMAGIAPVMESAPLALLGWLALVFGANFGLQIVAYSALSRRVPSERHAAVSLISGNRNVALYLLALPPEIVDPLLPFIGCYQLPMYLTPLFMRWLYRPKAPDPPRVG
ncbi:hypothetical protein V8J82_02495 [Gymnodinialimonas sp. 2305UL16-5]|uniref:hypothetical protein n=1 Tax=Gymnodinialimonas mytili TaxID=3126503 RepID=UPI0030B5423E